MRKIVVFLLLFYNTIQNVQAQFLRRMGNQINSSVSNNGNIDSTNAPKHHHGKGSFWGNIRDAVGRGRPGNDSTLKLSGEDEVKPTHADLSKFNTREFYKLQDGEKFSFYEACLLMQADKLHPRILVVKDGKPWLIGEEGQHIAVDPKKIAACPIDSRAGEIMALNELNGDRSKLYENDPALFAVKNPKPEAMPTREAIKPGEAMQMIEAAFRPRTTLVFRGKVFGPYMTVESTVFDRGAGKFLSLVEFRRPKTDITTIKGDFRKLMEPWLVGSDGTRIRLPGNPVKIIADQDLHFVRIYSVENIPGDPKAVQSSLFDPKTGKTIIFIDKEGLNNDPAVEQGVDIRSGHVITKRREGRQLKLYVNDKWITTLDSEADIPLSNVYVGRDASNWAIWGTKGLYFSNGETVDGVISVRVGGGVPAAVGDGNLLLSMNWIVLGKDDKTLELCRYEL
jgi:hypothetical protein